MVGLEGPPSPFHDYWAPKSNMVPENPFFMWLFYAFLRSVRYSPYCHDVPVISPSGHGGCWWYARNRYLCQHKACPSQGCLMVTWGPGASEKRNVKSHWMHCIGWRSSALHQPGDRECDTADRRNPANGLRCIEPVVNRWIWSTSY